MLIVLALTLGGVAILSAALGIKFVASSDPDDSLREVGKWLLQLALVFAGTGVVSLLVRESDQPGPAQAVGRLTPAVDRRPRRGSADHAALLSVWGSEPATSAQIAGSSTRCQPGSETLDERRSSMSALTNRLRRRKRLDGLLRRPHRPRRARLGFPHRSQPPEGGRRCARPEPRTTELPEDPRRG
jgi:hypothetical protein